ncbi:hypothetical protein BGZ92_005987, partial [Podila epicladia]
MEQILDVIPVQEMLSNALDMTKLQEQFLEMTSMDVQDDEVQVQTHKRRNILESVDIPATKH